MGQRGEVARIVVFRRSPLDLLRLLNNFDGPNLMSSSDPDPQPEPFNQPLAPLLIKEEEKSRRKSRPKAVMAELPDATSVDGSQGVGSGAGGSSVLAKVERLARPGADEGKVVPRWKFWKRSRKREEEIDTLRRGATEMVDLMRSIRDHLEGGHADRDGILKSLSPLPTAVESLKSMSDRQAETGRTLEGLHKTLEQRANRDGLLLKSLNRMGTTMSHVEDTFGKLDRTLLGMDQSNQNTARNMELLGDRMADTGQFMNESFAQLRDAEREFTNYISQSARRSGIAMVAVCSLLVLSVVAVGFMFRENRNLLAAVQQNGALVVQVPARGEGSETGHRLAGTDGVVAPTEARRMEELGDERDETQGNPAEAEDRMIVPAQTGGSILLPIIEPGGDG